ncbi:hypothetical protein GCM10020229_36490 [Kitasatospora albolonga]
MKEEQRCHGHVMTDEVDLTDARFRRVVEVDRECNATLWAFAGSLERREDARALCGALACACMFEISLRDDPHQLSPHPH